MTHFGKNQLCLAPNEVPSEIASVDSLQFSSLQDVARGPLSEKHWTAISYLPEKSDCWVSRFSECSPFLYETVDGCWWLFWLLKISTFPRLVSPASDGSQSVGPRLNQTPEPREIVNSIVAMTSPRMGIRLEKWSTKWLKKYHFGQILTDDQIQKKSQIYANGNNLKSFGVTKVSWPRTVKWYPPYWICWQLICRRPLSRIQCFHVFPEMPCRSGVLPICESMYTYIYIYTHIYLSLYSFTYLHIAYHSLEFSQNIRGQRPSLVPDPGKPGETLFYPDTIGHLQVTIGCKIAGLSIVDLTDLTPMGRNFLFFPSFSDKTIWWNLWSQNWMKEDIEQKHIWW